MTNRAATKHLGYLPPTNIFEADGVSSCKRFWPDRVTCTLPVTRTVTVISTPSRGQAPPAAPIEMSASLERTTYGLGGSTVALHREGQLTPGGPYIEELYYMHGNHLGSMTLLTDEAGDVVEEARYYPFGGYRLPPTAGITDIGFTGHRQDNLGWENTGLIYMGARYYDPLLRRFISADTIVADGENSLAYNRFAYVYNNPVNMVDPTGRIACDHPNLPDEGPCNDDGTWAPGPEDDAGLPPPPDRLMPHQPWPAPIESVILDLVHQASAKWGIPSQILYGLLMSERILDTDITDMLGDAVLSLLPLLANAISNVGPGIGNIHLSTLRIVIEYFASNYSGLDLGVSSGATAAQLTERLLDIEFSINAMAAYARMLADYRFGSNGVPLLQSHADITQWKLDDALALWHGYRYGVIRVSPPGAKGFLSLGNFQNRLLPILFVGEGPGARASIGGAIPIFCRLHPFSACP